MLKNKKQNRHKKAFSILIMGTLLAFAPLQAKNDSNTEAAMAEEGIVFTIVTHQIPTSLEKSSIENSCIHVLSRNYRTYDFSIDTIIPEFHSTKSLETYAYIQNNLQRPEFQDSLFEATLVANLALHAADYFSTREALKYQGLQEGNPLMKPFVKNDMTFAAVKIGLTVSNHFAMRKIYKKNKTIGWILSIVSNLALSYVVSSNMAHINEFRNR